MRAGLSWLLLLGLLVALALHTRADAIIDDGDLLVEEEVDALGEQEQEQELPQVDPRLTEEAFDSIISKLTARCRTEIEANPTDPSQVSERCRSEVGHKVQRYLARLDREEQRLKDGDEPLKNKEEKKPRKKKTKKSKKQARADREAADARKKEAEYQDTLQVILGFVATVVAIVVGVTFFINRKLKAAGMYYPAEPDAKASCCN